MSEQNICKFNISRSGDIHCASFVYETGDALSSERRSERYMLGLVIEGEGCLRQGAQEHALRAGDLFVVLREERFSIGGERLSYCYISFSGRRAEEITERIGVQTSRCVFGGFGSLCPLWLDAVQKADAGNTDLLCEGILLYSLAHLHPDQQSYSDLVTKAVMLTHDRFTEADFSLADLSRELGYDAKYLSYAFKKRKGISFSRFLRELRIRHAIFLMEQGVASVKNVALLSGFSDALYFSKVFTAEQGISPKAYIASVASGIEK